MELYERRPQVPARLDLFASDAVLLVFQVQRQKCSPLERFFSLLKRREVLFGALKGGHGYGHVWCVKQAARNAPAEETSDTFPLMHEPEHAQGGGWSIPRGAELESKLD